MHETQATFFAPAGRDSAAAIALQKARLRHDPIVASLLQAFPDPVMIVNDRRQVLVANNQLLTLCQATEDEATGLRPGEAVGCVHSAAGPDGCGTSPWCRHCGAVGALLEAIEERRQAWREVRLTYAREGNEHSVELRVLATPLPIGDETFTIFALRDISDERRRELLERVFIHDLLNTAGGVEGLAALLSEQFAQDELVTELEGLSHQLVDEIQVQRDLAAAERGELQVQRAPHDVAKLLDEVRSLYEHHPCSAGRRIISAPVQPGSQIVTDGRLLRRVIGNLVKNALEASEAEETVFVRYAAAPQPTIAVWNPAVMPDAVQRQIFHRSFSTKDGIARGLGTWGSKLLVDRYLGGRISFRSVDGEGTTFRVQLPPA